MKRLGIISVLILLLLLVGWSLVNQHRRAVPLGARVAEKLSQMHGSLQHAAVLVDFVPPAGQMDIPFEKKILWRNGEGLLREKDHRDVVQLKWGDVEVFRYQDDRPVVRQWLGGADVASLRKAFMANGFLDEVANAFIRDALAAWNKKSDADLLMAMLVADEGAMIRSDDPDRVAQLAIAMTALDVHGPVGIIHLDKRMIYVFQEQETASFQTIAECRWVAFSDAGREEYYGVIRLPREKQDQTMRLLWDAVKKMADE